MLRVVFYTTLAAVSLLASQTPCHTRQDALHVAAVETHGEAVSARRIELNAATGGWEVLVHMEHEDYGWKVIIDRDNGKVRKKTKCTNPPSHRSKQHVVVEK